jgi:Domain of unknown function (DUF4956)
MLDLQIPGLQLPGLQLPTDFLVRFVFHLVFLFVLVRFLYYPQNRNRNLTFSFLVFGMVIFFVMFFMIQAKVSLGFAFGAMAIFSILRYRTDPMSTKDLTYLLVVIGLSVLNAILPFQTVQIFTVNALLLAVTFFAERIPGLETGRTTNVQYERLELIVPERHHELIADLEQRTGWVVRGFEVGDIDFLKDTVLLRVMYQQPRTPKRQGLARDWQANATD